MLSKRMEAVAGMVPPGSPVVADVGCDHAYVSIALVERRIACKIIAMDVRKGPLAIAADNIREAGLAERIELRLGDGLAMLRREEADAIVIAGMGGLLTKRILEQGIDILSGKKPPVLILQPQSDIREVRIFLHSNAYHIVQEKMLVEEGKYYTVMRAEPGKKAQITGTISGEDGSCYWNVAAGDGSILRYTYADWEYGRYNLEHRDEILHSYLLRERSKLLEIRKNIRKNQKTSLPGKTMERLDEVCRQLQENEAALRQYYGERIQEE